MSDHKMSRRGRLHRAGRTGAIVAGGVLAVSAVATGTASAHEGEDHSMDVAGYEAPAGAEAPAFSPTTPMDAFVDHWMEYHYHKDITEEPQTIMADPQHYANIHAEMAKAMLGMGSAEGMGH
jgi:hypothetical protein